jgi:hypothetical protein
MLTEHRATQAFRPGPHTDGWRWWIVTGLTGVASVALCGFGATTLGFESGDSWVAWVPLALAGVITGAVGGLRGWRLLVPTAVAPLAWLGVVSGEGVVYQYISGFGYWSLVIGTTAVATVVASWLVQRLARYSQRRVT